MLRVFVLIALINNIDSRAVKKPISIEGDNSNENFQSNLYICEKFNSTASLNLEGQISVVMKLTSWQFSIRQAYMLNKLEARFRLAGYKNIHFIILSEQSNSTQPDDFNAMNKLKIRKSNRTMNISENLKNMASNVTVLNADADGEYFNPGSAYVFDQCARLAYIIYYPWSSIQRPYVKASILSTIYDAPCGECDVSRKSIFFQPFLRSFEQLVW